MVSLNSIVKDCDHHSLSSEATVPGRLNVHVKTASSPAIQMPLSLEKNRDVPLGLTLTKLKMHPVILMPHTYLVMMSKTSKKGGVSTNVLATLAESFGGMSASKVLGHLKATQLCPQAQEVWYFMLSPPSS